MVARQVVRVFFQKILRDTWNWYSRQTPRFCKLRSFALYG